MEDIIDIIVTETTNTIEITAQPNDEIIDVNIIDNREDIVLNVTPTVVEININSLTSNFGVEWGDITGTLANQTDLNNALALKANLVGGKVPASELPSYVDDVVEVSTFSALPATGEIGKIYVILDTNKIYRWSGSVYVEIADSTAVWGAITGTLSNQTDLQNALNAKQDDLNGTGFVKASGTTISYDNSTYALDSAVVKLAGAQTITGLKTFSGGLIANVSTGGDQGFYSINTSTSASSVFVQNNSTGIGILANNALGGDAILIGNDTSGRGIYITNATISGSGKGISIDNYNSGIGIEVGSDSSADAIKVLHLAGRAFNIQSSGGGYGVIINNTTASTSAPFTIQKQGASVITLTDAGAGTFNSSLTANSFIKTSGTSSQFLKADGSVDSSVYALDSAVVKLTGTQTIAGVKTFSSQPVFGNTVMLQNTASGTVLFGGYTTIWTTDSAFTALVGTASSTTIGFSLLYDSSAQRSYTMPTANGTLALTSQLSSYLPLSGGTLTGALSGTNATFSGNASLGGSTIPSTAGNALVIGNTFFGNTNGTQGLYSVNAYFNGTNWVTNASTSFQNAVRLGANGTINFHIGSYSGAGTTMTNWDGSDIKLSIASTGAATFSSSVTATDVEATNQFITSGGNLRIVNSGGQVGMNWTSASGGDLYFRTATTERMRITSGGKILINTTSTANTLLGSYTKQYIVGDGSTNAAASHGSMFVGAGTSVGDSGISVNQGTSGMTMLLLASINTGLGTSTNTAMYIVRFYFDGNNTPTTTYVGGSSDFVTFGKSGSNTLTLTGSSSGNKSYAWFVNKYGDS